MIYHYTTIQSLALILDSKKIRFTRIDCLDDIKEIDGLPEAFKTAAFVSCWTEDEEENISLWSLYTQMKGVRISLPQEMFKKYFIKAGDYGNWGYTSDIIAPLPLEKIRTDDYVIHNPFWLDDGFYKKIIYSKSFVENKKQLYEENSNRGVKLKAIQNLFIHKDSIWEFQKESRFYLIAFPLPPLKKFKDRETQMLSISTLMENTLTFIDVDLDETVLKNIIVRLSPTCTESDKIIVDSLLKKYTSNGILEPSNLKDKIRNK